MRFSRPLLLALVLLLWAFPASARAEEAPLSADKAEELVTAQLEHTVISDALPNRRRQPVGRPRVVEIAFRYLGTPYRWAGASPAGFDCSGFVMYVYGRFGIRLPHSSWMLWGVGKPVARKDLRPGDIVFFNGRSHVGIYIGNGRFVHSPHTGDVVRVTRLSEAWYGRTYDGARRV
jgi:cell wall-associated NlpC family hydrolase